MGTLRKLIYRCLCIEEEEESVDLLSSDFHARSQLVSPLSAISSGKTTRFNDGIYDSYLSAKKKKATVIFSDTPVKTVLSADSSTSKEKLIDPKKQPSVHLSHTSTKNVLSAESSASKEKLICPKKQASVQFSDTTTKKVLSADSSASKEKLIDPKKHPSVYFWDTSTKKVLSADSSASKENFIKPSVHFSNASTKKVLSADSSASKENFINPKKQPSVHFSNSSTKKLLSTNSSASKEKLRYPKKREASVHLSDTAIKKVLSRDSSASKEKRINRQKQKASVHLSNATIKNDVSRHSSASKEKLIYPQKESTKHDSMLMESKKIASESHDALTISSCNNQNKHLTVESSRSSHSDSLRRNSNIEQLDSNTVSRYLANWEISLTTVAALLESQEEHEPRYTQKSMERHSGPHDKGATSSKAVDRKIQDYCSSQKILLVGEGDFSFSACLAKAFGSAENIVATSLNSEAYLRRHYRNAMNNISQLIMRGCKVYHGVDATNMEKDWRIEGLLFDRIIYNFPHSGDFSSTEIAGKPITGKIVYGELCEVD